MARSVSHQNSPKGGKPLPDWASIADKAVAGDRLAYAMLMRLVTGYLTRWRANDFRGDWEDIVQEVLLSTLAAHREGRLPTAAAFQAYVRQSTRFKFVDQIRNASRHGPKADAETAAEQGYGATPGDAPWPPTASIQSAGRAIQGEVRDALERLGERERTALLEVYLVGRTYDEAAKASSIPLGSLKRALRTGLAQLREILNDPS